MTFDHATVSTSPFFYSPTPVRFLQRGGPPAAHVGGSASIGGVISLRRRIERGLKHPVIGPLLAIVLLLLLAFVAAHAAMDQASDGDLICVVFGILLLVALNVPRPRGIVLKREPLGRAPPMLRVSLGTPGTVRVSVLSPLRL